MLNTEPQDCLIPEVRKWLLPGASVHSVWENAANSAVAVVQT